MKTFIFSILLALGVLPVMAQQRPQIHFDLQLGRHRHQHERRDNRRYNDYRYQRGEYVTYETRYAYIYGELYRVTYQVQHLPNGRVMTTVVARQRVYR
jgi:hypothetical protein